MQDVYKIKRIFWPVKILFNPLNKVKKAKVEKTLFFQQNSLLLILNRPSRKINFWEKL